MIVLRPLFLVSLLLMASGGCYAPLRSPGIPASTLPDHYRTPKKACSTTLNYATLTRPKPVVHQLRPKDVVRIEIADLTPRLQDLPPIEAPGAGEQGPYSYAVERRLDEQGEIMLPFIGLVNLADLTLVQARERIIARYSDGFLDQPLVSISLIQPSTARVLVLGNVARPSTYELPLYENDVAHALAAAGGILEEKADEIQVHRKASIPEQPALILGDPSTAPESYECYAGCAEPMLRIPLRSHIPVMLAPEQVTLEDGDVVVVEEMPDEVFFVVGKLSGNNTLRFSVGRENRDLGNGFVLPKDRDVDVVTAVAMAGYIDPIDSPTTVTVHRTLPNGTPMLILVDLIAARSDREQNVLVEAGDIIYLNPDGAWWFRRTLDRIIPELLLAPYIEAMERWIDPRGFE